MIIGWIEYLMSESSLKDLQSLLIALEDHSIYISAFYSVWRINVGASVLVMISCVTTQIINKNILQNFAKSALGLCLFDKNKWE